MYQKTIKLFLQDGDPNERIICELSNWDGIAYKIPRAMLKESKELKYISNTGDYILFWENDGISYAYIGEAENLYNRMIQHLTDDKDLWTECILFTRKDNSLNKAHVKYIENKLYISAKKSARFEIINNSEPTQSSLSEYEEAEMQEIIDNIKMLTNALGYKVFVNLKNKKSTTKSNIFMYNIKGLKAEGQVTNDGFMILKDSQVSKEVKVLSDGYKKLRDRLINENIINKDKYIFNENYTFDSTSAAGAIVAGHNVSGPQSWKNKENGKTIKELGI